MGQPRLSDGDLGNSLIIGTGQTLLPCVDADDAPAPNKLMLSGKWRILLDPSEPKSMMMSVEVDVVTTGAGGNGSVRYCFYSTLDKDQVMSLATNLSSMASRMQDDTSE